MLINTRFPLLSTIAKVLWIFAIILVIIGGVLIGSEMLEYSKMSTPGAEWIWSTKDIIKIVISAIFIPLGVIIMAIAEIIGVFFAIELNTRNEIK